MAKLCTFELENDADVHAETDYGGETMPIHELCAQELQRFETGYKRGTGYYSLDKVEKLRIINKFVMDKKENKNIRKHMLNMGTAYETKRKHAEQT